MENNKKLIWQDIKDLANSLTAEQLQQQVRYWTSDEGGNINDANVLDEDYVNDGVAYVPASEVNEGDIDTSKPIVPEGTVMLWMLL